MNWFPQVQQILADVMCVPPDAVQPNTVPNDIPAWDSLRHLNLIVALEQTLGVKFTIRDIDRMTGIAEICEIVGHRLEA
ncbi:MAG TPA: acyl carrier protein [Acetobacteraceae bacterium]|nr:acyl carrier protein [Acetobacteraceae bacterium]